MPRAAARAPALSTPAVRRPGRAVRDLPRRRPDRLLERRATPGSPRAARRRRSRRRARSTSRTRARTPTTAKPRHAAARRCPGERRERFMLTHRLHAARAREPRRATSPARSTRVRPAAADACSACRATALTIGPTQATRADPREPGGRRAPAAAQPRVARPRARTRSTAPCSAAPRIVPVGDALVHVQPVYVTAGGSGVPAASARDGVRERPRRATAATLRARRCGARSQR